MQEQIQKDLTFAICPNILHADADANADAEAGGIAIALLHKSAGALTKSECMKLCFYIEIYIFSSINSWIMIGYFISVFHKNVLYNYSFPVMKMYGSYT